MPLSEEYVTYICDQVGLFTPYTTKKMFGGMGFFHEGKMWGLISANNVFRLKVDDSNRTQYEEHGMKPMGSEKHKGVMPYYQVPEEVIDHTHTLKKWIFQSIAISKK